MYGYGSALDHPYPLPSQPQQLRAYAVQEERGFSLYTFVNEVQWRERKALEAEINALRAEWVRSVLWARDLGLMF